MLLHLTNAPRDYAWGSDSLLAELEGREPTGAPEAEVWFGDHPGDPADVTDGGTLDAVTGGKLPYLLKLLAAAQPLHGAWGWQIVDRHGHQAQRR